jgi:hypothetical protein
MASGNRMLNCVAASCAGWPFGDVGRTTPLMRILVAIPHFFNLSREVRRAPGHGSLAGDPGPRIEALTACVSALHQLFGCPQVIIDIARLEAKDANARFRAAKLDVVVCTTKGQHLLARLSVCRLRGRSAWRARSSSG